MIFTIRRWKETAIKLKKLKAMGITYKSLALAILMTVVSETLSELMEKVETELPHCNIKDLIVFHKKLKKMLVEEVARHRKKIYDVLSSAEFVREYPVMKKVMKLPVSNLKKSIIFLAGIGCTTLEISRILQCDKGSAAVMRSTSKSLIVEIFKH